MSEILGPVVLERTGAPGEEAVVVALAQAEAVEVQDHAAQIQSAQVTCTSCIRTLSGLSPV